MEHTKYHNLFKTNGIFKYVYQEGNFKVQARDCNDLKFKLAMQGITLKENKSYIKNKKKTFDRKKHKRGTYYKKSVKNQSKNTEEAPLRKNIDYVESKDDVNFGKIRYIDPLTHTAVGRWGPDNSERARKLRKKLIR